MQAHSNPAIISTIRFTQLSSDAYDIIFKDVITKTEENSSNDYYMATGIRFGSIYDELIGDGKYDIIFKQAQLFIQNFKSPIFDDEEPVYINSGSGIIGISKKKKKPI